MFIYILINIMQHAEVIGLSWAVVHKASGLLAVWDLSLNAVSVTFTLS